MQKYVPLHCFGADVKPQPNLASMKIIRTTQSRISEVDFTNLAFGTGLSDHTFLSEYSNGSWDEGRIEPYGPLKQGLALHALHYGQAVFEGQKAYRQVDGGIAAFRPRDNAKRLNRSGARMMIPELPEELFMNGLDALIAVDQNWVPYGDNQSLYLRPFLFGSSEFITARPSENYTFGIVTSPSGELYTKPVRVKVERQFTRATEGGVGFAKAAGNYGGSFLATREAVQQGYQQVLWTDHHNHEYFEEAGTMNVAFVVRGTLITPALSDRILAGITRDSILTLCKDWGIPVEERLISVKEIIDASLSGELHEAFGMGTAAVVSPIEAFGMEDEIYSVPVPEDSIAARMRAALSDIRYGRIEDSHGWMHRVALR